jgi:hypothetical protein
MENGAPTTDHPAPEVLDRWSARKVPPVVVLYVAAVMAAFMVLAHFVFNSPKAVKALVLALVGAIAATVPGVLEKVEYQLTDLRIEKRSINNKKPGQFKEVFCWDHLSHVVPTRHGFKYFNTMTETNPIRRFWKRHITDEFSGEVHVEKDDMERILGILERRGVSMSKPR